MNYLFFLLIAWTSPEEVQLDIKEGIRHFKVTITCTPEQGVKGGWVKVGVFADELPADTTHIYYFTKLPGEMVQSVGNRSLPKDAGKLPMLTIKDIRRAGYEVTIAIKRSKKSEAARFRLVMESKDAVVKWEINEK